MPFPEQSLLVVEGDVIVRVALGAYLRACGFTVLEVADGAEAKAILQSGLVVNVLLSDAELAGAESGFTLAHWVRRYRPSIDVLLATSVAGKAQAAAGICRRFPGGKPPSDAAGLAARIRAMLAERKRRTRPSSSTAPSRRHRRT